MCLWRDIETSNAAQLQEVLLSEHTNPEFAVSDELVCNWHLVGECVASTGINSAVWDGCVDHDVAFTIMSKNDAEVDKWMRTHWREVNLNSVSTTNHNITWHTNAVSNSDLVNLALRSAIFDSLNNAKWICVSSANNQWLDQASVSREHAQSCYNKNGLIHFVIANAIVGLESR